MRWITAGLMNASGAHRRDHRAARAGPRASSIGLRSRTVGGNLGSKTSAQGSSATAECSSPITVGHRLQRPAREEVGGARRAAGHRGGASPRESALASASPQRSRAASAAAATARSGGSASKPLTWTTFTPASARAVVELLDHPPHERDLPGQVHVVGAVGDAGLDHRPPVERVRADEVEDDPRAGGHRRQRGRDRRDRPRSSRGTRRRPRPRIRSSLPASRAAAAQVKSVPAQRPAR